MGPRSKPVLAYFPHSMVREDQVYSLEMLAGNTLGEVVAKLDVLSKQASVPSRPFLPASTVWPLPTVVQIFLCTVSPPAQSAFHSFLHSFHP